VCRLVAQNVAAAGDLLWIGTHLGRLIRYETNSDEVWEVSGRMGAGKMASAVWRISADPYSRSALVILGNADVYYASSTGPVRPRWLAKLRGMRCVAATWLRVPASAVSGRHAGAGEEPVVLALLGTAFGSIFALALDVKHERDDHVRKVWSAPSGERIDGIRVERVAGNYVATVATTSVLYMLFGVNTLDDLFSSVEGDAVHRLGDLTTTDRNSSAASAFSSLAAKPSNALPLPSELQFMSSMSCGGVASRRFVWAAQGGILHAQLALRSRRAQDAKSSAVSNAISASVTEKSVISWQTLKDKSGSSAPIACNLSTFHILVLYPGSVYAYNQISGELTQQLDLWRPLEVGDDPVDLLNSPAAGFVRDALVDSLWVYTEEGQLGRVLTEQGELRDAWRAAKAVGRFDLAMALAPLVSGEENVAVDYARSREAVLEAQADHAAANGDWDAAARLYAKTNRPVESVLIDIAEACARELADVTSPTELSRRTEDGADGPEGVKTKELGSFDPLPPKDYSTTMSYVSTGSRSKFMIVYLVCKLDTIPESRPSQRTIVATMLVELYASCLSRLSGNHANRESGHHTAMKDDFRNFLVDHIRDLHFPTALSILTSHRCYQVAKTVAVLAGEYQRAGELCLLHADADEALELLGLPGLEGKHKDVAELLESMSGALANKSPQRLADAWIDAAKSGNDQLNHRVLLSCLARVARSRGGPGSQAAYTAVKGYITNVLCGVSACSDEERESPATDAASKRAGGADGIDELTSPVSAEWHDAVRLLFALHAECGSATEAEASYDCLIAQYEKDASARMQDTLGDILLSGYRGKFWRLIVRVYGALGLHEEAVSLALERGGGGSSSSRSSSSEACSGSAVAEAHVVAVSASLGHARGRVRGLWLQLARAASDDDVLGVVERSGGVLRVDDALPLMADFSRAEPRVTAAVAASLAGHQDAAARAAEEARHTLERTVSIRRDIATALAWRAKAVHEPLEAHPSFSAWCASEAVDTLDKPIV
jgi:hypothetical protein